MERKKAAVFILLGQSNAVGHGVPMAQEDEIKVPLKNVYGLHRKENQSFDIQKLTWSGYTSDGMNLGETQDHTYSLANCLAMLWQKHIDQGNGLNLPDLYIVQIAIGAQGVTEGYMWHPEREIKLIPGELGTADISLFPFCKHIFGLLDQSFREMDKEYEIIGLHWRGGENDITATMEHLETHLEAIYSRIFDSFNELLSCPPTMLHKIVCPDHMDDLDPTGNFRLRMHYINAVFDRLADKYENLFLFDPATAPQYNADVYGNGLFIEDAVHFTPEVNFWVANSILTQYGKKEK